MRYLGSEHVLEVPHNNSCWMDSGCCCFELARTMDAPSPTKLKAFRLHRSVQPKLMLWSTASIAGSFGKAKRAILSMVVCWMLMIPVAAALALAHTCTRSTSRRQWLTSVRSGSVISTLFILQQQPLAAVAEVERTDGERPSVRRPTAPIEYLVPAAQIKLRIDASLQSVSNSDKANALEQIQQLRFLWLDRPFLDTKSLQATSSTSSSATAAQPAQSYQDRYNQNRQQLSIWQQPGAFLVQRGEVSAWQRLVRQEQSRAAANPFRAALNLYTDQLVFSSQQYVLTVEASQKSSMIRNNQLPTVTSVITADLDIRTLYRNQLLTCMDDLRAELSLPLSEGDVAASESLVEIERILREARGAMDTWMGFIDPDEVQLALRGARQAEDAWDLQQR